MDLSQCRMMVQDPGHRIMGCVRLVSGILNDFECPPALIRSHQQINIANQAIAGIGVDPGHQIGRTLEQDRFDSGLVQKDGQAFSFCQQLAIAICVELVNPFKKIGDLRGAGEFAVEYR